MKSSDWEYYPGRVYTWERGIPGTILERTRTLTKT